MLEEEAKNEQESGFSEMNFAPKDNVGKFEENGTYVFCCFSCKAIKEVTLQMYGQRLSQATTQTYSLAHSAPAASICAAASWSSQRSTR